MMQHTLVSITLSPEGMATIKASPELQKGEMEFINQWKAEGILASFFISLSRTGAILIFTGVDEARVKELVNGLPYFPYMSKVEYTGLNKQF